MPCGGLAYSQLEVQVSQERDAAGWNPGWRRWRWPAVVGLASLIAAAMILVAMGRSPWCTCAEARIASWDVWSEHNSQHILDPYTFSHVLHGIVFYGVAVWVLRGSAAKWRLPVAMWIEAGWEILENTALIIDRYRESTMALDYYGDSVANSLSDIVACAVGVAIAAAIPWWASVLFFVGTEAVLVWWIKDSLILNVIMLVWPLQAIKDWQTGG